MSSVAAAPVAAYAIALTVGRRFEASDPLDAPVWLKARSSAPRA